MGHLFEFVANPRALGEASRCCQVVAGSRQSPEEVRLDAGNRRVSAPRRDLLAASTASRARYARFTIAEDAKKGQSWL